MSLDYYRLLAIPIDSIEIIEEFNIFYRINSSTFAADKQLLKKADKNHTHKRQHKILTLWNLYKHFWKERKANGAAA